MPEDTAYNPYIFGPPVQDPEFFFGREHELTIMQHTIAHLVPGLRQSMAVVGPRRIGKTSLLLQLIKRLEPTANATAFMSTEQIVPRSPLLLTQEILAALRAGINEKHPGVAELGLDLLDRPAPADEQIFQLFQRDMRRINEALKSRKLPAAVLVIDEVEGLLEFGGLQVLGMFRHLAQSLAYVLFVVAGSDRLYYLMNDTTSPFFNVFKTINIAPLPPEQSRSMILQPAQEAGLCFEPAAVEEVVQLSGGIPYLINMLCHYAAQQALAGAGKTITEQHVTMARLHILTNEQGYFLYIWQQTQSLEKVVLYVLANAPPPRTLESIAEEVERLVVITQPISQVSDYVKDLVQRQILREDVERRVRFGNKLLPLWIRANRTASQIIEESLSSDATLSPASQDISRPRLLKILTTYFDTEELRDLSFDLGVSYDDLGGSTKSSRAREMIFYFERRDRLPDLVDAIRLLRPNLPL